MTGWYQRRRHAATGVRTQRRLWMRNWRFESERPTLFESKSSLERLRTKNVIELSVLREAKRSRICMNEQRFEHESKSETALARSRFCLEHNA
jgi:hypothetical protein